MQKKGYLVLETGDIFEGVSFGFEKDTPGEVVFNTGMVGYPEGFTDPSYCGQILTMTYPLIGNYGVPKGTFHDLIPEHFESSRIWIAGLIVSSYMNNTSHFESVLSLSDWLIEGHIPALHGIDTRSLTKILRSSGVAKGVITFENPKKTPFNKGSFFIDINKENLVSQVSVKTSQTYGNGKYKILFLDCGYKSNQIRLLLKQNTTIVQVPWNYKIRDDNGLEQFDGVFISNGPGDPKMVKQTIQTVQEGLKRNIPTFGICLGNQILALASGADTYKLKYGHRGQNQPVRDEVTKKCFITTHNHGFAVDTKSIPEGWESWFTNLNDGTNEGIRHSKKPFFSCQFHPESMPGPTDTEWLFEYFIEEVKKYKH